MRTLPLCRRQQMMQKVSLYLSALHKELSMYGDAHNCKTTIPPDWKSYVTTFRCGNFMPRLFDVLSHTLSGNYGALYWSLPHRNCNYGPILTYVSDGPSSHVNTASTWSTQHIPRTLSYGLRGQQTCHKIKYNWINFSSLISQKNTPATVTKIRKRFFFFEN
jgi:hypothetical protein